MLIFRAWATRVFICSFSILTDLQLESAVCRSPHERDSIDDQLEMAAFCQVVSGLVLFQSSAAILNHVKSPVKLSGFKTNRA